MNSNDEGSSSDEEIITTTENELDGWFFLTWKGEKEEIEPEYDVLKLFKYEINSHAIMLYRKKYKIQLDKDKTPKPKVRAVVGFILNSEDYGIDIEIEESQKEQFILFELNGKYYTSECPILFRRTPLTIEQRVTVKKEHQCDLQTVFLNFREIKNKNTSKIRIMNIDDSDMED